MAALGFASRAWPPALALAAVGAAGLFALTFRAGAERDRAASAALAVALAAAWLAGRPPWAPLVSAVVWAGAVVLASGLRPATPSLDASLAPGALLALGAGGAAALAGVPPVAAAMVCVAGRLAAASLLALGARTESVLFAVAVAMPGAAGGWGALAALAEGAAALSLARGSGDARALTAWALAGALAGVGAFGAASLGP